MSKAELFAKYLEEIGLLAADDSPFLIERFESSSEDKSVIFELSNYVQQLSTASQYDLSSRIYQIWMRTKYIPMLSSQLQDALQVVSEEPDIKPQSARFEADKQVTRDPTNEKQLLSARTAKSSHASSKKNLGSMTIEPRKPVARNFANKFKGFSPEQTPSPVEQNLNCLEQSSDESAQKLRLKKQLDQNRYTAHQRRTRSSSENAGFNRLYEQRFIHEENRMIRKEMSDLMKLRECSFSPSINKRKTSAKATVEHLKTPVFQRLSRPKSPREHLKIYSREYRELEGVTFKPDLSKSSRRHKLQRDESLELKGSVSERLYQDAQLKKKILQMKKEYLAEKELAGCTFTPRLVSSASTRNQATKDHPNTIERMELDSRRRHHMKKLNEEAKANEPTGCSFQPQRFTHDYDQKLKERQPNQDSEAADIFTRLYQSARKRQELEKEFEEEMMVLDSKRISSANTELYKTGDLSSHHQHEKSSKLNTVSTFRLDETSKENAGQRDESLKHFDKLYEEGKKRKEKLVELEQKIMKEMGITFTPMTNRLHHSLQSARKKSDAISLNKENEYALRESHEQKRVDTSIPEQQTEIRAQYHNLHSTTVSERNKQQSVDYNFDDDISQIEPKTNEN